MSTTAITAQHVAGFLNVDRRTFSVRASWPFRREDIDPWIAKQIEAATKLNGDNP